MEIHTEVKKKKYLISTFLLRTLQSTTSIDMDFLRVQRKKRLFVIMNVKF